METGVRLRAATASDAATLHRWDTDAHVLASDPNDDWQRHEGFAPDSQVHAACRVGWPRILSSLKTLLETGRPLPEFAPVPEHLRPAQESSA
jgi:hypothetical protein